MNTSFSYNELPSVEREIADLYAWGLTKKEIANRRGKSIHTVENQIRNLFIKTGTRKDTEFTSWYFCSRFGISFNLSPLCKGVVSICLLAIVGFSILNDNNPLRGGRSSRVRSSRIEITRTRRAEIE